MVEKSLLKSIPQSFTAYDVLCYIVPSGMFVLCTYLVEFWSYRLSLKPADGGEKIHTPLVTALSSISEKLDGASWAYSVIFVVIVACMLYALGHIIASVSSFFLDRVFVTKAFGYPYVSFLNLTSTGRIRLSTRFYRAFFFWVNLYLLIQYVSTYDGSTLASLINNTIGHSIILIIECIIIISIVLKFIVGIKYWGTAEDESKFCECIKQFVIKPMEWILEYVIHWPFEAINSMFERYTKDNRSLSNEFIGHYREEFHKRFIRDYVNAGTDNYWLPLMYVCHVSNKSSVKIDNWHRLYSFARNLSTGFYLSFIYSFLWVYFQSDMMNGWSGYSKNAVMVIPIFYFLASMLMFFRYRYLYTQYYTKYILRAFVFHSRMSDVVKQQFDIPDADETTVS